MRKSKRPAYSEKNVPNVEMVMVSGAVKVEREVQDPPPIPCAQEISEWQSNSEISQRSSNLTTENTVSSFDYLANQRTDVKQEFISSDFSVPESEHFPPSDDNIVGSEQLQTFKSEQGDISSNAVYDSDDDIQVIETDIKQELTKESSIASGNLNLAGSSGAAER